MSEKPRRTMMEDLEKTAVKVREYPSYMRTSSSVARVERDMRRAGIDPVTRQRIGSPVVREQVAPVNQITPDTDYSTETFRQDIHG